VDKPPGAGSSRSVGISQVSSNLALYFFFT
jgi:hypothetical protein